jgi:stearoyl-CoA desaturase (delta-9 desaturase)
MKPSQVVAAAWEQPFWKPSKGKGGILFYLLSIHLLAATGLILFPAPGLRVFGLSVLLTVLGGLGTTVGYHRALAHRSLKLKRVIEQVLIFCAVFNGSGAPRSWVAYHRQHHSRSDTPNDISSPKQGGFWWAHLRWLYQSPRADVEYWAPEIDGRYKAWTYAQLPILLLSLGCGAFFGWAGFFWMGAIRLVYSLHMQCLVNSLTHLGEAPDGDSSRNVWWLGPLQLSAWGENWHRNHHSDAGSARFGRHWWQVDIGWYFIRAASALRLARSVRCGRSSAMSQVLDHRRFVTNAEVVEDRL